MSEPRPTVLSIAEADLHTLNAALDRAARAAGKTSFSWVLAISTADGKTPSQMETTGKACFCDHCMTCFADAILKMPRTAPAGRAH